MVPERAENSTHHGIGGAAEALTKATSFKLREGEKEITVEGCFATPYRVFWGVTPRRFMFVVTGQSGPSTLILSYDLMNSDTAPAAELL
jgi:hypothetical protein